jgi:hypothetical protein
VGSISHLLKSMMVFVTGTPKLLHSRVTRHSLPPLLAPAHSCDGSDEYSSGNECSDTCEQDGAAWRELQAANMRAAAEGAAARRELVTKVRGAGAGT